MTATNDTPDLEALFDSIAATTSAAVAPSAKPSAKQVAASIIASTGDSDELQDLFDSFSTAVPEQDKLAADGLLPEDMAADSDAWPKQEVVFNQIGQMARSLHDTICGLGYDKLLEKTVSAIPDAKDRLAYVANLTEQAACKVLNATDVAVPVVDDLNSSTNILANRWDLLFENKLSVVEFKALAEDTRRFLRQDMQQKRPYCMPS